MENSTANNAFFDNLTLKLNQRKEENNYRKLTIGGNKIDFYSNDYLGLAQNEELIAAIEKTYQSVAQKNKLGSTGSRLISGNSALFEETEQYLAEIFGADAALIFNSGYVANLAFLSALPQKGDTIIYDELCHASIKDGMRLSFADRFSYSHNDLEALEKKLKIAKNQIFVVTESIFSMDGDAASLAQIAHLCGQYNAHLLIDQAHSTGIFGKNGCGMASEIAKNNKNITQIFTFGKALGSHGACVTCSAVIKDYLINFSRPFIYTTAMPLHNVVSIKEGFEYLKYHPEVAIKLHQNIAYFKEILPKKFLPIASDSAIQIIMGLDINQIKLLSTTLLEAGFLAKPILSPTVKKGSERIRICVHSFNTTTQIKKLVEIIVDVSKIY